MTMVMRVRVRMRMTMRMTMSTTARAFPKRGKLNGLAEGDINSEFESEGLEGGPDSLGQAEQLGCGGVVAGKDGEGAD
jgi:hypothetical protein